MFAEYFFPGYWVINRYGQKEFGPYKLEKDAQHMAERINKIWQAMHRPVRVKPKRTK